MMKWVNKVLIHSNKSVLLQVTIDYTAGVAHDLTYLLLIFLCKIPLRLTSKVLRTC